MINNSRLLNNFLDLVRIDSVTFEEKNIVDHIIAKLAPLQAQGISFATDDAGPKVGGNSGNLIIKIPGSNEIEPILFNAHLDTVEPGRSITPSVKDGIISSNGSTVLGADDKAGVAAILEMVLVLVENENLVHGPIEVVFTIAEEKGLMGAKNLDLSGIASKMAFVFDSAESVGHITVRAPFHNVIDIICRGKATHAGVNPESGVSAIVAAANAISRMALGRIDFETTANIGVISGGRAANIVPDEVNIKAEARSLSEVKLEAQTRNMIDIFEAEAGAIGADVVIEAGREYDGFNLDPKSPTAAVVAGAAMEAGFEPVLESTGGGSDTNVFNSHGLSAVGLGVGYIQPHSLHESIAVTELEKAARLALAIAIEAAKR